MSYFCQIFDYFNNHVGVQDWVALIGLNVTVIGLTSLAEKRNVVGIDYGKYLIDEYKLWGVFRIYHILIGVAFINALSLVVMLHGMSPVVDLIVFVLLIVSSWFVLLYLFSYVMRVHPRVKREIYRRQVLGLYIKADVECNFKGDRIVGMPKGDRTPKKISSNIQSFFNLYNEDTVVAFAELFGPNSPVYARDPQSMRVWKKLGYGEPHEYNEDKSQKMPVQHISWEFFQMFRRSDIQDRWLLEILNLFNGEYADAYPRLRLYNVARVLGQINRVGFSDGLWKYKFVDYLMPYIVKALDTSGDNMAGNKEREEVERYLHEQLAQYFQFVLKNYRTPTFEESVAKAFRLLLDVEFFRGVIPIEERIKIYGNGASGIYLELIEKAGKHYEEEIGKIKNIVLDFGNVLVNWNPENLYKDFFSCESEKNDFYSKVLTADWIKEVDASETLDTVVEARKKQSPRYEKALDAFRDNWIKTVGGEITGMKTVVGKLKQSYNVYGLSNWCKDAFLQARSQYAILQEVENYVISGGLTYSDGKAVGTKPDQAIYTFFLEKFKLDPSSCLFIDDRPDCVKAARESGMKAIVFKDAIQIDKLLCADNQPEEKGSGSR